MSNLKISQAGSPGSRKCLTAIVSLEPIPIVTLKRLPKEKMHSLKTLGHDSAQAAGSPTNLNRCQSARVVLKPVSRDFKDSLQTPNRHQLVNNSAQTRGYHGVVKHSATNMSPRVMLQRLTPSTLQRYNSDANDKLGIMKMIGNRSQCTVTPLKSTLLLKRSAEDHTENVQSEKLGKFMKSKHLTLSSSSQVTATNGPEITLRLQTPRKQGKTRTTTVKAIVSTASEDQALCVTSRLRANQKPSKSVTVQPAILKQQKHHLNHLSTSKSSRQNFSEKLSAPWKIVSGASSPSMNARWYQRSKAPTTGQGLNNCRDDLMFQTKVADPQLKRSKLNLTEYSSHHFGIGNEILLPRPPTHKKVFATTETPGKSEPQLICFPPNQSYEDIDWIEPHGDGMLECCFCRETEINHQAFARDALSAHKNSQGHKQAVMFVKNHGISFYSQSASQIRLSRSRLHFNSMRAASKRPLMETEQLDDIIENIILKGREADVDECGKPLVVDQDVSHALKNTNKVPFLGEPAQSAHPFLPSPDLSADDKFSIASETVLSPVETVPPSLLNISRSRIVFPATKVKVKRKPAPPSGVNGYSDSSKMSPDAPDASVPPPETPYPTKKCTLNPGAVVARLPCEYDGECCMLE